MAELQTSFKKITRLHVRARDQAPTGAPGPAQVVFVFLDGIRHPFTFDMSLADLSMELQIIDLLAEAHAARKRVRIHFFERNGAKIVAAVTLRQ